jgi:L-lactate dehydrogenase (cytochrome)
MIFNPHALGVHKVLKHIPLNAVFDAPYKRALKKAVNIADLRLIAKSRSHKVSEISGLGLHTPSCLLYCC